MGWMSGLMGRRPSPELYAAAEARQLEDLRQLLQARVGTEFRTAQEDRTALVAAAHRGHVGVVEALLAAGADENARDVLTHTALHFAAGNGHKPVVATLWEAGAARNDLVEMELGCAGVG